jgi:tetraacyldisaccharide 4'-kinase
LNQQSHRRLISGQSSSLGAFWFRVLLRIASFGYSLTVRLRNFLYSKGWLKTHRVNAAVICVGNITTGGTGKTPLVVWFCRQIAYRRKCAILTRGYKSTKNSKLKTKDHIDEPAILTENCPGVEAIVNPDRVAGAAEAIRRFGAEVLIMDDGFQHRRLARDLDIVAIDATQPFGYGKMLPAGLLREPVTSLKRADAVVITRCDQIGATRLSDLEVTLRTINPDMVIAKSMHAAASIKYLDPTVIPAPAGIQNETRTVDSRFRGNDIARQLKDKRIFAFCGIGNPDAFLNTIRSLGADLVGSKIYDDHYHYTDACLVEISEQASKIGAGLILTTQKDWTKLISDFKSQISDIRSSIPFACLTVEIQFLTGRDELKSLIESAIASRIGKT